MRKAHSVSHSDRGEEVSLMWAKCTFLVKELSRTRVVGSHMASRQILGTGTKSFENNVLATIGHCVDTLEGPSIIFVSAFTV